MIVVAVMTMVGGMIFMMASASEISRTSDALYSVYGDEHGEEIDAAVSEAWGLVWMIFMTYV